MSAEQEQKLLEFVRFIQSVARDGRAMIAAGPREREVQRRRWAASAGRPASDLLRGGHSAPTIA
jgi:hypothetical protein